MGFIEKVIGKKEEKPRAYGVCIPLHEEAKKEPEAKEKAEGEMPSTAFEVDGYYQSLGMAMLRGTVKKGKVTPKKKAVVFGKEYRIAEIQRDQKKVPFLEEGEYGALFLRVKGLAVQGGLVIEIK
ncbi:MAG: hypothetical protein NT067_04045 [Candidatus Diapherotrites archaeon]|nr:hypothetical protein [Candidatus Diapherotrites archaeon]